MALVLAHNTIISLDISTHTGYAVFTNGNLIDYGVFTVKIDDYVSHIKSYADIPTTFPKNVMSACRSMARYVKSLCKKYADPMVVIEHVNPGRQRISQLTLCWLHYAILNALPKYEIRYMLTSDWRKETGCYISKHPDVVKHNKMVSRAKRRAKKTKSGARVAKIDGHVVAPINQKKLAVRIVNDIYSKEIPGFHIKDDNIADAILIGRAAHKLLLCDDPYGI